MKKCFLFFPPKKFEKKQIVKKKKIKKPCFGILESLNHEDRKKQNGKPS